MGINELSVESLRKAIGIKEQIEQLESELSTILGEQNEKGVTLSSASLA